jgi:hypothetical protein
MLKKHRKNVLQSKSIEKTKSEAWPLSKIKASGEYQSKECVPHTCTSRSSCMTSFFLDPAFGSTISCDTSESHTYLLTPKIGTRKRLTCEPNLVEECHSAGGFPQSIR